jgi:hypothetical protein
MADPDPDASPGTQRQLEIYKLGLVGKMPTKPFSVDELAHQAKQELDHAAYDYLAGGGGVAGRGFAVVSDRSSP